MNISKIQGFERHALLLKAMGHVLHTIAPISDLDLLLSNSVNISCAEFELSEACIYLVDESGEWAQLRACSSEAGRSLATQGHQLRTDRESIVGAAIADRKVYIDERNGGEESVVPKHLGVAPVRSVMALPLTVGDDITGAL